MIVTILGIENKTYAKKDTGELVECLQLHYSKPLKAENCFGSAVGSEFVSGQKFPEQFRALVKGGATLIGKKVSISKDVVSFGGQTRAVLDELEILS